MPVFHNANDLKGLFIALKAYCLDKMLGAGTGTGTGLKKTFLDIL
jgi:hypothetical protein